MVKNDLQLQAKIKANIKPELKMSEKSSFKKFQKQLSFRKIYVNIYPILLTYIFPVFTSYEVNKTSNKV